VRRRGSISPAGEGRWYIRLSVGRGDSRIRPHYTVTGTRADAERELTRLLHELDSGSYVPPATLTLEGYLHRWLREHCDTNLAARTAQEYRGHVRRYIQGTPLGQTALTQLRPLHIQRWLNELRSRGLSAATVRHAGAVLHRALVDACRWGLLSRSPMEHIPLPVPEPPAVDVYGPEEVARYVEAARGHPSEMALLLAVYTGARAGEICALQWRDIDDGLDSITFQRSLAVLPGGQRVLKHTKSGRAKVLPVIQPLREALREQRARQARWRMLCSYYDPAGFVASWEDGAPFTPDYLSHRHQAVARAAGLRPIRLHGLRHTCATLLLEAGVDIAVVSRWLGHSSIAVTARTYAHVTRRLFEDAAGRLERRLEG